MKQPPRLVIGGPDFEVSMVLPNKEKRDNPWYFILLKCSENTISMKLIQPANIVFAIHLQVSCLFENYLFCSISVKLCRKGGQDIKTLPHGFICIHRNYAPFNPTF